jgi:hypothetical protein
MCLALAEIAPSQFFSAKKFFSKDTLRKAKIYSRILGGITASRKKGSLHSLPRLLPSAQDISKVKGVGWIKMPFALISSKRAHMRAKIDSYCLAICNSLYRLYFIE